MKKENVCVSVIIPHKNSPDKLIRCVQSIPLRKDVELVIVDDASDKSVYDRIVSEIKYNNLQFIRLETSGGAGHARNVGLAHSQGEWVMFADCDDLFADDINSILDECGTYREDVVFFAVNCLDSSTLLKTRSHEFDYYPSNINEALSTGNTEPLRYSMNPPWGKLMRRTLLSSNDIQFDVQPVANDVMFSIKSGFYAKTIGVRNYVLYNWTVGDNSLSTLSSCEMLRCRFATDIRKNKFLSEHNLYHQYHVNLFKKMRALKEYKINVQLSFLFMVILNTKPLYIIPDLLKAVTAMFHNNKIGA